MVEYFCCPAPTRRPDGMEINETTKLYRVVLKTLVYGEIGAVVGQAFIYGWIYGATALVNMWITYVAYATMHPCCVVIMGFCSAMELLISFMNACDNGTMHRLIFDTTLTKAVFFSMFAFSITKLFCSFRIYKEYKAASEGYPAPFDDNFQRADGQNGQNDPQ